MAAPGSTDLAGARSLYDEQESYLPNDTGIFEGCAVCWDNTSGDNLSIVLPGNVNALLAGRAFAGISSERGSPILAQDKAWSVQRAGIANCALKNGTATTRGQVACYDPADGGYVKGFTGLSTQVPIGQFIQTKSSGTGVMVGVALWKGANRDSTSLLGKIVGPSSVVTNHNNVETAYDKTLSVPPNLLSLANILRITGYVRSVHAADNAHVITLYLAPSSGALTAGIKLATSPSATPGNNDVCPFQIDVDLRTGTALVSWGAIGFGAAGAATMRVQGSAGTLTYDPTVANTIGLTALTAANGSANDQTQLEALAVEILGISN